jgi:hypothetical protein
MSEHPRTGAWTGSRLGLLFYFDTNFVDDESPAALELRQLDADGWLLLARSDTVDTELATHPDQRRRAELHEVSSGYPESLGPMVLDHSRLGFAYLGTAADAAHIERVLAVLFPGTSRHSTSRTGMNNVRDAMHVATTIRCGGNVFITRDKRLLAKSAATATAFNGFQIMTPERALAFATRVSARYEYRMSHPLP